MLVATGTYDVRDLLAVRNQTVTEFGEERAYEIVRDEIAAHNARYQEMAGALMTVTTERLLPYGGSGNSDEMDEVDEYGRVRTQKTDYAVGTVGLPLRKYAFAAGYTREFIRLRTPAQLAEVTLNSQAADVKLLYREIRKALFVPTNYTWRDIFVDRVELNVKRLLNADGSSVPAYEGTEFNGATHTHYLGSAAWSNAAVDASIATVREHGYTGEIRVRIAAENYGDIAALSKFMAAPKELIQYNTAQDLAIVPGQGGRPDNNRIVGVWDGQYYIETKPWVPQNYTYTHDINGPRPLAFRVLPNINGLYLAAQIDSYPLRAEYFERYFGIGVAERTNGAVTRMNSATYAPPPIN